MDNLEKLVTVTRTRKTKQKRNTICVGHVHHKTQTNTNNVDKTASGIFDVLIQIQTNN